MSKVGMNVTYTPTVEEQPMSGGKPQAALVTGWDEVTNLADLIVFPKDANYGYFKDQVSEGTEAGTFQQFASGTGASTASAGHDPSAKSAKQEPNHETTKHEATTHRGR